MSGDSPVDEELGNSCKKYVNENVVKQNGGHLNYNNEDGKFGTAYEINGEIFRENNIEDVNVFCEFEVEERDEISDDIYLDTSIQKVKNGILLNSRIFLTLNQWNTLMLVDEFTFCLVCDEIVHQNIDHINENSHVENLEKYKPLKKFDDNITRLIDTKYHCAVCNDTFDINTVKQHYDSQNHKGNMLHALNRAVNVNLDENNENSDENTTNETYVDNNGTFDANNGAFDDDNGVNSDFKDDLGNSEGFYDYNFSDDNCNELQPNNYHISYASVASKPNIAPKYISQIVGDKTLKVPYNSWNMVITPWANTFYCISCKTSDHISLKAKHCMDNIHLEGLTRCPVVVKYDRFLMRQVDLKYYHCAYCNILVLISDVDDHIAGVHVNKSKNTDEIVKEKNNKILNHTNKNKDSTRTSNKSKIDSMNRIRNDKMKGSNEVNTDTESNESFKNVSMNQGKMKVLRDLLEINNVCPDINNDIIVEVVACKFRISFVAYNTVLVDTKWYYCVLCDLKFDEDSILHHIRTDDKHIDSLKAIPFDGHFGHNLIRLVYQRAHCSICNTLLHQSSVLHHITTPMHLNLLNQARISTPETSVIENNYLPKQIDLNPTMHPMETNQKSDSPEIPIESNQNNESLIDTNESIVDYNHEFIYLNFKNVSHKITFASFNSVVVVGDGTKYCFVCSVEVSCFKDHTESVAHTKCMNKCKFIDKYDKHILRQMCLSYHCCTCNVIFSKRHLKAHLSWPLEPIKTNKIIRKKDIKSGIRLIHAKTQNEQIYPEFKETAIKILFQYKIKPKTHLGLIKKESKIVSVSSNTYKISWDSWQGLSVNGSTVFCNFCDKNLKEYELSGHINEEFHSNILEKTFSEQYYPNLVRIVNDKTANCVICNSFITNKKHIILEHLNGKRHITNYNNMRININYDSCIENVLKL